MNLGRVQKQLEDATKLINEARTGVGHLMALFQINESLLQALPAAPSCELKSDKDIAKCISW